MGLSARITHKPVDSDTVNAKGSPNSSMAFLGSEKGDEQWQYIDPIPSRSLMYDGEFVYSANGEYVIGQVSNDFKGNAVERFEDDFNGFAPTLDASNGVDIGDVAVDTSIVPSNVWRCLDNTIGSPNWKIKVEIEEEQTGE